MDSKIVEILGFEGVRHVQLEDNPLILRMRIDEEKVFEFGSVDDFVDYFIAEFDLQSWDLIDHGYQPYGWYDLEFDI